MNINDFVNKLKEINIIVNENQLEKLNIYAKFLIEYNKHTNLTRIINEEDIYLKHFYDSLTLAKNIDLNKINNLIDIGTGAGFPGMVIKIIYPNIEVSLLDSNNKKTKFLEELAKKLEVKVNIFNERSEDFAKNNIDKYDLVVSRAVANLRVLSELCLPLVKINGNFIALKGNIENELEESKDIIKILNGNIEKIDSFKLPYEESTRNNIFIKKVKSNPKGYPRPYNKILKG